MGRSANGPHGRRAEAADKGRLKSRLALRTTAFTALAIAALAVPATACGDSSAPAKASLPLTPCTVGQWSARCGTLRVPEDRDKPSGRQIDLRVVVISATGSSPQPDPLFMLAGGPGEAASSGLLWTPSVFATIRTDRDIVLIDQRGTGESNRLVMPETPDTSGLSESEASAKLATWSAEGLAALKGDPRFYTTSVAMDDVDDVRAALGYDKINLYGASYGATAAQYYLRQHEAHVRAVVFDGGSLLDVPLFERMPANSQRALDILFSRCKSDPACNAAFPGVRDEFATVMARLADEPVTLPVVDPATGRPAVLGVDQLAEAMHQALVDRSSLAAIPSLVHAAYEGDWARLLQASGSSSSTTSADGPLVMSLMIRCSEAWARFDPAETARSGTGSYLVGAEVAEARSQAALCSVLPAGVVPANDAKAMRSDVPALFVVGEADPQDPPANIADAPKDLPNSLTVVVPGQAHTVGHLGCMPAVISSFIEAGTTAGLDVSCVATGVPLPPFVTSA